MSVFAQVLDSPGNTTSVLQLYSIFQMMLDVFQFSSSIICGKHFIPKYAVYISRQCNQEKATEGKTNWDNLHVINLKGTILPVESIHGLKSGDVILVDGRAHIYSVHFAERLRSRG